MEYETEGAVVHFLLVAFGIVADAAYEPVEILQLAAQVRVYGCR